MTQLERFILLSYCYREKIIYDYACHLMKCCVNPVRKEVTAEAGDDGYGRSEQVTFLESCGSMVQSQLQPHDRNEQHGVSVCLSVCPSVYRYRCGLDHMVVKETGKLSLTGTCGGRKLRTDLQSIS